MAKTSVKHSGGKVGQAGRTLQSSSASKQQKSNAAKTLNNHKQSKH